MQAIADGVDELFRHGRLDAAVAAANQAVRQAPGNPAARVLLAELLVFTGNLLRADTVLDAAASLDPSAALVIAEFRQLLRAETARHQLFRDGRPPEFLGEPSAMERALLAAQVALRAGEFSACAMHAAAAETARPPAPAQVDGVACADLRDADDLCGGVLEVLTVTGKYLWVPIARIASIDFHPPRRPRDLAWRRASVAVVDGPEGEVYVPALYVAATGQADPLRLGRATEWSDAAPVRGAGQRVFLAGEAGLGIMDITAIRFAAYS